MAIAIRPTNSGHQSSTMSSLSASRRQLNQMMQRLNFGRIEGLHIRNGQPVFQPMPRLVRELKFGSDNQPRPELAKADFVLKAQVIELFATFDQIGNGVIDVIEIKHGLPFRLFHSGMTA